MTPLQIEILMHYHTTRDDYRNGDLSAPAVKEAIELFLSLGILKRAENPVREFEATEAVAVYAEALCAVPLPVRAWVMPDIEANSGTSAER